MLIINNNIKYLNINQIFNFVSENLYKINNFTQTIIERDKRDSERKISPTKPAFYAYIIDTSFMKIENVEKYTKGIINFYK